MGFKTLVFILIFLSLLPITWNRPIFLSHSSTAAPPPALALLVRGLDRLPVAGEQYRSFWDILQDCGLAIFACTWTAVHMNIPARKIGWFAKFQQSLQRAWIMCYAVLAPEAIFLWALRQRLAAKRQMKEYNQALDKRNEAGDIRWTLTHGFYVQMGGFMLHDHDNAPICVLTHKDLIALIQANDIEPPDITEEEIEDKSKSGIFPKLLALLQLLIFVGKTMIDRVGRHHLPITNLELGVVCHCVMDIAIYACWLNKPFNVDVPTPVKLLKKEMPSKKPSERDNVAPHTGGTTGSAGPSGSVHKDARNPVHISNRALIASSLPAGSEDASESTHNGAEGLGQVLDGGATTAVTKSDKAANSVTKSLEHGRKTIEKDTAVKIEEVTPSGPVGKAIGDLRQVSDGGDGDRCSAGAGSGEAPKSIYKLAQSRNWVSDRVFISADASTTKKKRAPGFIDRIARAIGWNLQANMHTARSERSFNDLKKLSNSKAFIKLVGELERETEESSSSSDHGWKRVWKEWEYCRKGWLEGIRFFIILPYLLWKALIWPYMKLGNDNNKRSGRYQVPMFSDGSSIDDAKKGIMVFSPSLLIPGTLFSGAHLFAWNWYFPTTAEQTLWRTVGIITTAAPCLSCVIILGSQMMAGDRNTTDNHTTVDIHATTGNRKTTESHTVTGDCLAAEDHKATEDRTEDHLTENLSAAEHRTMAVDGPVTKNRTTMEGSTMMEDHPTTEDLPITEKYAMAKDLPITEKYAMAKDCTPTENHAATEGLPATEEQTPTVDGPVTENRTTTEDSTPTKDHLATDDLPVTEEHATAGDLSPTENHAATEDFLATEKQKTTVDGTASPTEDYSTTEVGTTTGDHKTVTETQVVTGESEGFLRKFLGILIRFLSTPLIIIWRIVTVIFPAVWNALGLLCVEYLLGPAGFVGR